MSKLQRTNSTIKSNFKRLEPNPRECGAIWSRVTKDGQRTFLSGKLTITKQFLEKLETAEVDKNGNKTISFAAFTNSNKTTEKAPDYHIVLNKED